MTNLDSILKSRDITLPTKVHIVKAMVFPVAMYGSECWTIKKADHWRMDAFELWCWRRLLRVPWTARRTNLSILKEINPECSLEGQILKLRLQDFGHLMRREDSLESVKARGEGDDRGWDDWTVSLKWPIWIWPNSGRQWKTGGPAVFWSMGSWRVGHNLMTKQQQELFLGKKPGTLTKV